MNFEVGSSHRNRRGLYKVVALDGSVATIEYQDGRQSVANVVTLMRIEENLMREQAFDSATQEMAHSVEIQHKTWDCSGLGASSENSIDHRDSNTFERLNCRSCNLSLANRPQIDCGGASYCFHCAKKLWDAVQFDHLRANIRIQNNVALGIAIALVFLFPPLGIIGGLLVWGKREDDLKALSEFARRGATRNRFTSNCPDEEVFPTEYSIFGGFKVKRFVLSESCNDSRYFEVGYDRRAVLARDLMRCQKCGSKFGYSALEVHHVKPRKAHGTDSIRNLVTLCISCHMNEDWFGHYHEKNNEKFPIRSRRR